MGFCKKDYVIIEINGLLVFRGRCDIMWELIQVKDQIKYKIIKNLFQAKKPVTIETLSIETSSSQRSIKNYLSELKSTVTSLGGSIETSNDGIQLHLPSNIGLDLFERQMFKNTPGLVLLELIFHNNHLCSTDLIDMLFLSSSTFNRLIRSLKEILSSYGLSIDPNPYRITGEEILIRRFYSSYFQEAYSSSEWPFEEISENNANKLLHVFLSSSDIGETFYEYSLFRMHFTVNFIRNKKGYSVMDEQFPFHNIKVQHSRISSELKLIICNAGVDSEDTQLYADQMAYWNIYYSPAFFKVYLSENPHYGRRISSIEKPINELADIFDLPAFDKTNILKDLDTYLELYCRNPNRIIAKDYILFKPRDYYLIEIFKCSYFFFYEEAEEKMKSICIERDLEPCDQLIESMMHILLTKWEDLTATLFKKFSICKVLVYSHLNYTHAENIVSSLHANTNRVMDIEIYKGSSISEKQLSKYSFDILVSSTTLSLDIPQKIQYLHYKIHGPFVQPLVLLIDEIVTENKRNIHTYIRSLT
ncbi:helix-turn-helix domain-containing protein [Proteiniclasticum sp.]|uniref:helix-turn-helix domain-containing protein n=1 Tax=Proteiniclasticum sp. TaxID=2053595 RepID=UPI0028993748|nr:helix-turn-helix domain-containing protein [Proteiniclasticum sp.]